MKNKVLDKYKLDIFKLPSKQHEFVLEGANDFFDALDQDLIEKGNFKLHLTLDKSETMIQATYDLSGSVELTCDRSLEQFDFPFSCVEKLIYKFGDHYEELSEDLYLIDRNMQKLDISHDIFEFIFIQIPMKKISPKCANEEDEDDFDEDGKVVYSTIDDEDEIVDEEEIIDPRWATLKNLKDN